ncbi:MAG: MotA/TolQ/ExbB proton channel family protein [Bacteroidaceae bacterium]|nr:MotA/TolQ/ExbB proton channel family protein [Bacteroidaceae bacterium]
MNGLFRLFVEGSVGWMTLVTLALVGVLIAMWKAPNWVKEIGLIGLALGILGSLMGCARACTDIVLAGDVSPTVLCGGIKVMLIPTLYGMMVYLVSVVVSLVQSPRK